MKRRALLRARTAGFAAGLVCAAIWTGYPLHAAVNADGTEIPDAKSTPAVEEQPPEYKNWIEFAFGGTTVDGDRAQFEQAHRIPGDQVFGGISDLHFEQTIGKDVEFKLDGHAIFEKLLRQGIIVRPLKGYNLPEWVRISVGTMEENKKLVAALEKVLRAEVRQPA